MLGQFCEECAEAIQAAQKVRRSMKGTTPVSKDDALVHLTEECADVALLLDCLIELGLVDRTGIQFIGRYKTDRWYGRIFEPGEEMKTCQKTNSRSGSGLCCPEKRSAGIK